MTKVETKYGFAQIIIDEEFDGSEYVRIDYVEITKEYRGQGHARELMEKAIEKAREMAGDTMGVKLVAHEYDEDVIELADLVAFYESCGFEIKNADGTNVVMAY
jgi:GNAT superfamily N-acetyltransferase